MKPVTQTLNGEVVHDPHPSRAGLLSIDEVDVFLTAAVAAAPLVASEVA